MGSSGHLGEDVFHGLHHVQLAMPSGEEAAARAFFVGVLGMSEIAKPPVLAARGGVWFREGGLEVHLGVEEEFRPAKKGHPGILVADLDEIVERLRAASQDVAWDDDFPGFRRVYAHDPFGNRLEFLQIADVGHLSDRSPD
jgi:catechol 2,3-dioxygenase-like lactoylglutathione lyase family enzyme